MTDPRDRFKSGALGTELLVDPDGILFFFLAGRQGQTSLQSLSTHSVSYSSPLQNLLHMTGYFRISSMKSSFFSISFCFASTSAEPSAVAVEHLRIGTGMAHQT